MPRHADRPALVAPARIHATVNGARISLPGGGWHLVGGWEDSPSPRTTEYIRADIVEATSFDLTAFPVQAVREIADALSAAADYFDNRADADCDQDGFVPNVEMRLLTEVNAALAKLTQRLR